MAAVFAPGVACPSDLEDKFELQGCDPIFFTFTTTCQYHLLRMHTQTQTQTQAER